MGNQDDKALKNDKSTKVNCAIPISLVIVVVLVILACLISIMSYAWAKYGSKQSGGASANVAKWYFNVIGNGEQSADNINFAITRTDNNRFSLPWYYRTRNIWEN